LEKPRYIPPAAQFERQRGTDLRQPPASLMSQNQKTSTVSHFCDKQILAKTGTLELEIKVDTNKKLTPKLKGIKKKLTQKLIQKLKGKKKVSKRLFLNQLVWISQLLNQLFSSHEQLLCQL
jgi:hypothetical protein